MENLILELTPEHKKILAELRKAGIEERIISTRGLDRKYMTKYLYSEGWARVRIAAILNCTRQRVYQILK